MIVLYEHTTQTSTVALDYDLKVAKFQTVKRQNVSKRLSLINISPQPLPDFNNLKHRRGKCDKDTEKKQ